MQILFMQTPEITVFRGYLNSYFSSIFISVHMLKYFSPPPTYPYWGIGS